MKERLLLISLIFLLSQKNYPKEIKNLSLDGKDSVLSTSDGNIQQSSPLVDGEVVYDEFFFEEEEGRGMYDLFINGAGVSRTYPIYEKNNKKYISLYDFIELLGLKDFVKKDNVFTVKIGIDGLKRKIDFNNKRYWKEGRDKKEVNKTYTDEIFEENGAVFIEKELFQELFDSVLVINEEKLSLNISTKFETPKDIEIILENRFNNIENEKKSSEILYESKKELFTLGNVRLNFNQNFSKSANVKSYKKDWTGNTEYSGGFLYGNFTTSYDVKSKKLGTAELYYTDIWKGHSLKIGSYPSGEKRELGLRFEKEKGYYLNGKEVIIREKVPIGSVVELIYLGTAIDIQHADDGYVEFINIGVQLDRKYSLKIYTPTGEILTKEINTSVTYNQQDKGEVEYSLDIREDNKSGDYRGNIDVYYGITERLTLSTGFSRVPVDFGKDEKPNFKFDDRFRLESIYTNYLYDFPYTVSLNTERAVSKYGDKRKNLEDLHTLGGLGTITINDLKLEIKDKHNGKYFDEKRVTNYNATYDILDGMAEITTNLEYIEKYDGFREKKHDYGVNIGHSFKDYSLIAEYTRDDRKRHIYRGDLYYNGFEKISIRLSGEYTKEKQGEKDKYQGVVALRNKGWNDKFDFSVEAKYKNTGESAVGLSFSVKVDDWFVLDGSADRDGNRSLGVGIDKVISLSNPLEKIKDLNSSRVKVTTFLDKNRNNVLDKGEESISGMDVSIGDKKVVTDSNGVGYIYDLSNGLEYEVKAKVNRPEYNLSYSSMKVLPKHVSEIEVDIPVQPLVTLEGYISLDGLDILSENEVDVFNDIVITVMDENGKELEHTIPEDNGGFQVSGLFSEKYKIKIQYLGDIEGVEEHIETVELAYGVPDRNRYVFNLMDRYSKLGGSGKQWN